MVRGSIRTLERALLPAWMRPRTERLPPYADIEFRPFGGPVSAQVARATVGGARRTTSGIERYLFRGAVAGVEGVVPGL